eukprot:Phypoly_transcript_19358.p1 GENE.Phypoly_transcript_19358~~Phypoly_transcript_19358.p1  ORF type:complete len:170 (+),score=12.75 Phypoly_transcript_19358:206-715(+)
MDESADRGKKYNACISVQGGMAFLDAIKCAQNNFDPTENTTRLAEIYHEIPVLTSELSSKYGRNAARLMAMVSAKYNGIPYKEVLVGGVELKRKDPIEPIKCSAKNVKTTRKYIGRCIKLAVNKEDLEEGDTDSYEVTGVIINKKDELELELIEGSESFTVPFKMYIII